MRAENYWEQFLSSGKIDDYLAYREVNIPEKRAVSKEGGRPDQDEGVMKSAGADQCNGNGFKG